MRCVKGRCELDPAAPHPSWLRSVFSGRVGMVLDDDSTLWCTPSLQGGSAEAPASVQIEFERVQLDGTSRRGNPEPSATQRVRMQCFADVAATGASTLVTSTWASDDQRDTLRIVCPRERPYAAFVQCQIASVGKPPLVYAGASCGAGVSGIVDKASLRGQLIGDHYELSGPAKPLFNNTGGAGVVGSDLGFPFLSQGRMLLGFGDTWENDLLLPGPSGYRGSILASSRDFEAGDEDGIVIDSWDTAPGQRAAREVIPSPHDQTGNSEFTAIATAGFGLSEGDAHYRFLWFAAIRHWNPYEHKEGTLAWSLNGAGFVRGDQAKDVHPPRWPFDSYFGPGTIWVDREHGYIYFFGVRTYQPGSPVRLARVRGSAAAVLDHLQYEYWTKQGWRRPDPADEYALARGAEASADLIPGGALQNNRPEFSVSYNPYVGRFLMLLQNDATPFKDEAETQLQLWEAEEIVGPWQRVETADRLTLGPHLYGPYMSEQTFSAGGRDVAFVLTEWNLLPLGQPYVVGLWSMQLTRQLRPDCMP